jgi:hypothetical protein
VLSSEPTFISFVPFSSLAEEWTLASMINLVRRKVRLPDEQLLKLEFVRPEGGPSPVVLEDGELS